MNTVKTLSNDQLMSYSKEINAPFELLKDVQENGSLPVPNFSAGGIATPADAALMMQLGAESVFVGSGIFKSTDPDNRAKAIVEATTHYDDPDILRKVSANLKDAMEGLEISDIPDEQLLQKRGW